MTDQNFAIETRKPTETSTEGKASTLDLKILAAKLHCTGTEDWSDVPPPPADVLPPQWNIRTSC